MFLAPDSDISDALQRHLDQERSAIAREVHDDIGGALTALHFDLEWIGRHGSVDDPALRSHLDSAASSLRQAMQAARRIASKLQPEVLHNGIVAALRALADEFTQRSDIPVDFHAAREDIALPPLVRLAAYRIAQESLTNVRKHAACSRVRIDISDAGRMLTLEIADDGRGLDPQAPRGPQSRGIDGMQERARSVGGWLDLGARPGRGTSITLCVPLDDDEPAATGEGPAS